MDRAGNGGLNGHSESRQAGYLGRVRGCLVGGAAGDALGYPVEFMSYPDIVGRFGADGIWDYWIRDPFGRALFSDDTQMTLFTAVGLLDWGTRPQDRATGPAASIYRSYLDWLSTQGPLPAGMEAPRVSWLADAPALRARRAPGNTCLSALGSGHAGSLVSRINDSKGCGGVMRAAPIGLFGGKPDETVRWAAEAAALTHGNPLGYMPAGALAFIVRECVYGVPDGGPGRAPVLRNAVDACIAGLPGWFPVQAGPAAQLAALLARARDLAGNDAPDHANIAALGEGWTGDEALAIAVYCCLRYPDSFDGALVAAVNHGGDSDSTGAVAGNIMGALLGEDAIGDRWTQSLELHGLILEVADSLHEGRMPRQEPLARSLAHRVHAGQADKAGAPYILHPAAVAARVRGDAAKAAAWLHDAVEDTAATLEDVRQHGLSDEVVQAVDALTRRGGEAYLDFVRRAAADGLAREVKVADVVHNMDLSRLPAVDRAALDRVRGKYLPALEILIGE